MPLKSLQLTHELKEALRLHSFQTHEPMSEIVCSIIADYAGGKVPSPEPARPVADVSFKYMAPPEYDAAMDRAVKEGVKLTQVIREEIARRAS